MLKMGKSKPWPYALEKMTGSKEMSVASIKEYFQPLKDWLVKERCSKKYKIGWPGQLAVGVQKCNRTDPYTEPSTKQPTEPNSGVTFQNCLLWFLIVLLQYIAAM